MTDRHFLMQMMNLPMITPLLSEDLIIAFRNSCTPVSTGSAVFILKFLLTVCRVSGSEGPTALLCSWQGEFYLVCASKFSLKRQQVFKMLYITTRGSDAPLREPDGSLFDCGPYGHAKIQRFVVIMAKPERQYSSCVLGARRSSS